MERLTREDWKSADSMMWKKVDELNVTEHIKKSMKDVLKKLAEYEDREAEEKKYNFEQIIDAITQAEYDIMAAFACKDRDMLESILKEYLRGHEE